MSGALPWIAQLAIVLPAVAAVLTALHNSRTTRNANRKLEAEAGGLEASAIKTNWEVLVTSQKGVRDLIADWQQALERRDIDNAKLDHELGELRRAREVERLDLLQRISALEQLLTRHGIPLP